MPDDIEANGDPAHSQGKPQQPSKNGGAEGKGQEGNAASDQVPEGESSGQGKAKKPERPVGKTGRALRKAGKIFLVVFILSLACSFPAIRALLYPIGCLLGEADVQTMQAPIIYTSKERPAAVLGVNGATNYQWRIFKREDWLNSSEKKLTWKGYAIAPDGKLNMPAGLDQPQQENFDEIKMSREICKRLKPVVTKDGFVFPQDWTTACARVSCDDPLAPGDYISVCSVSNFLNGKTDFAGAVVFRVTDLGVVLKHDEEKLLVRTIDLNTRQTLANVDCALCFRDSNEHLYPVEVGRIKTGKDGLAIFKRTPKIENETWNAISVDAKSGDHRAFAGMLFEPFSARVDSQTFYQSFSSGFNGNYERSRWYITTDRPMYRLGQTVNFKGFVRTVVPGSLRSPVREGISLSVQDPDGKGIWERNVVLDEFGAFQGNFQVPVAGHTGAYSVCATLPSGEQTLKTVFVEQYRKPEYKVNITPVSPHVVAGEKMKFKVKAEYYFGAPVTNARVDYSINSSTSWSWRESLVEKKLGSDFFDMSESARASRWFYRGGAEITGSVNTDAHGDALVEVDTALNKDAREQSFPLSADCIDRTFSIDATVTDLSRKTVTSSQSACVTAGDFALMLSTDSSVVKAGESIFATVKALDYDKKAVPGVVVELKFGAELAPNLFRQHPELKILKTVKVTTDKDGKASVRIPTEGNLSTSSYYLLAQSRDGGGRLVGDAASLWIGGSSFGEAPDNGGLSVTLDHDVYRHTDKARVMIAAPLKAGEHAQVLLTVEGHRIEHHQLVDMHGPTQLVDLPLKKEFVPNAFVVATFVDSEHKPLSASQDLRVTPEYKFLNVSLKPKGDLVRAGETVACDVKVTDKTGSPVGDAVMSLSVCDESIYALAEGGGEASIAYLASGGQGEDIYHSMFRHIDNCVGTRYSFEGYVLPSIQNPPLFDGQGLMIWFLPIACSRMYEGEAMFQKSAALEAQSGAPAAIPPPPLPAGRAGAPAPQAVPTPSVAGSQGDMAQRLSGLKTGTNARLRENFADVAAWFPSIRTDKRGMAEVTVKMPDDLTTWRLALACMNESDKMGAATTQITTSQDFIARLALPRFYTQHDRAMITAIVHNHSTSNQPVHLKLSVTPELKLEGAPEGELSVPVGEAKRLSWAVRPVKEGRATVKLSATGRTASDALKVEVPVRAFSYRAFFVKGGIVKEDRGSRPFPINIPPEVDRKTGLFELSMSASSIGPVLGSFDKLIEYPYGCTEQTLSKLVPSVVAMRLHKNLGAPLSAADQSKFTRCYEIAMPKLIDYQHGDGGWGWWKDDESNAYLTAHVLEGFYQLRQAGYGGPEQYQLDQALDYLQGRVDEICLKPWEIERGIDHAKSIYVLSLYGRELKPLSKTWQMMQIGNMSPESLAYLTLAFNNVADRQNAQKVYRRLLELKNESEDYVDWDQTEALYRRMGLKNAWYYTFRFTGVETTALSLRAVVAMEPSNEELIEAITRWLVVQRDENGWNNTKATAAVFLAFLEKELALSKGRVTNFEAYLKDGARVLELMKFVKHVESGSRKFVLPADKLPARLDLLKQGPGWLYYSSLLSYERPLVPGQILFAKSLPRDLKIEREFYRLETQNGGKKYVPVLLRKEKDSNVVKEGEFVLMRTKIVSPISAPYVMIEQPLPSGAEVLKEPVELSWTEAALKEQQTESHSYCWNHQDILDDRVVLFAPQLDAGSYQFDTIMRMEMPGSFNIGTVNLEAMYTKKFRGYSTAADMQVVPLRK